MKNKIYSILMLALIIGFSSCEKDAPVDANANAGNSVDYDGTRTTLKEGALIDFGADAYFGTSNTHLNYDFYTTDGSVISNAANELQDVKGKIAVYVWLESAGATTAFKAGTYTFIDGSNDGSLTDAQLKTKYENKNFLAGGAVFVNAIANTSFDSASTTEIVVKSGSVTVSGTKPNYTITYDLVLVNNKTVKGTYSAGFKAFVD